uniref:DUF3108 domain-containing protein n=1 Tax=Desulfatirhabdium butyrativorans TaxID=340467 RepID=A0A7C4RRB3_9BACT
MKSRIVFFGIGLLLIGFSQVHAATNYCNHALFPIQPQAEWTYTGDWLDSENEGYSLSVQSVFTRGEKSTAMLNFSSDALGETAYPLLFECNASNGITLVELNNVVIPLPNGTVVKLTLNEQSGAILPPMNQIQIGYSWPFVLDFKGSYTSVKGKSIAVGVRVEVNSQLSEILEEYEVPAGVFENVYVVRQDVSMQLTLAKMKKPIRTLNASRTWYLAEGVGPVSAIFLDAVSELISYSLPDAE